MLHVDVVSVGVSYMSLTSRHPVSAELGMILNSCLSVFSVMITDAEHEDRQGPQEVFVLQGMGVFHSVVNALPGFFQSIH